MLNDWTHCVPSLDVGLIGCRGDSNHSHPLRGHHYAIQIPSRWHGHDCRSSVCVWCFTVTGAIPADSGGRIEPPQSINPHSRHATKNSATKTDVRLLTNRISTLEANGGMTRLAPTATRNRPTSTPTRSRPTVSPTPSNPFVTTTRNMNVRRGPSTEYAIVGVASIGEEFEITGKNAAGNWWRIEYEGKNAWIYAPYVTATNADRIRAVPTPPPPPTATPAPASSTPNKTDILATALILLDQEAMGTKEEWIANSQSFQHEGIALIAGLLTKVAPYCDMSVEDTADLVNKYGLILDNVGYTARTGMPARSILLFMVNKLPEANTPRLMSCDDLFELGASSLLENE